MNQAYLRICQREGVVFGHVEHGTRVQRVLVFVYRCLHDAADHIENLQDRISIQSRRKYRAPSWT